MATDQTNQIEWECLLYNSVSMKINHIEADILLQMGFVTMLHHEKLYLGMSRSHFFAPDTESESFDFEYLPIPSPDPILQQCINNHDIGQTEENPCLW